MNPEKKTRTLKQNRAMHQYCEDIARTLNEAGLDMRAVLKPGVEISWTKEMVKEYLWKPVQRLKFGSRSTTELTTDQVSKVYEDLNRHLGVEFGEHSPFPSRQQE